MPVIIYCFAKVCRLRGADFDRKLAGGGLGISYKLLTARSMFEGRLILKLSVFESRSIFKSLFSR